MPAYEIVFDMNDNTWRQSVLVAGSTGEVVSLAESTLTALNPDARVLSVKHLASTLEEWVAEAVKNDAAAKEVEGAAV